MAVVDKIENWFICETCVQLKADLEYERSQKEYLQKVLLQHSGIIKQVELKVENIQSSIDDFRPVHRGRTLSSILKTAETKLSAYHSRHEAVPATVNELTEAERLFQNSLKDTDAPVQ